MQFQRLNAVPVLTINSAYAARQVAGGLLTFSGLAIEKGGWFLAHGAVLRDKSGQNVSYDLALYDTAPVHVTDKAAVANDATDLARCLGTIPLAGMSLLAASTMGIITAPGLSTPFQLGAGSTLTGLLITNGAPTFTGASDLSLDLYVWPR